MAVLCLPWKGKLLFSIRLFLSQWTNSTAKNELIADVNTSVHPQCALCPSADSLRIWGFVPAGMPKAEVPVSHHLIKMIITGSGSGAKKRKKAFQSLPLHFNRSPMLYNAENKV